MAQEMAFAVTDLNMRMGPGPDFEVVTVIPADTSVAVLGCTEAMRWCEVSLEGHTGWAYAEYLTIEVAGTPMIVPEATAQVEVPVVTFDGPTTGAAGGAIAGAIIGGPVGAVVGGVAGATLGAAITPPPAVRTHVVQAQVQPVFLEGEVVIGATLPPEVVLHPIPGYDYQFAVINHQRVLVDPGTRHIVYVIR
jgi:hypothetical protein